MTEARRLGESCFTAVTGRRARMRYHWFRSRGLFVSSGVVEASCKNLIGARLKQSGMHWTLPGADAIITLRTEEASRHWNETRNPGSTQTHAA